MKIKDIYKKTVQFCEDVTEDNVPVYSGQAAFFSILAAVPFLMLIILCLKYFVHVDVSAVTEPIRRAFPKQVSDYIVSIISEIFQRSENTALISVTAVTALWSASKGTFSIYIGLNGVLGGETLKNFIKARAAAFVYTIVFILIIVAAVAVLMFGNVLLSFLNDIHIPIHWIFDGLFRLKYIIFFMVFILAFAAIYTFLPRRKTKFRTQLPGAAATAVGWLLFSYGYSVYIEHFSNYSFLYGSIAAVILMMLWIYICIYMMFIGAEINKHIENGFCERS